MAEFRWKRMTARRQLDAAVPTGRSRDCAVQFEGGRLSSRPRHRSPEPAGDTQVGACGVRPLTPAGVAFGVGPTPKLNE